ncbi:unnamed protein product, partial [Sphenostylis stenocarpa]
EVRHGYKAFELLPLEFLYITKWDHSSQDDSNTDIMVKSEAPKYMKILTLKVGLDKIGNE